MEHKEYISISKEISKNINIHFQKFCKKYPEFKPIEEEYTKKRIHLNAVQFYAGFQSSKTKKNINKYFNVAIAIECIMLMAYKTNRILDEKQEIWKSKEKIKETILTEKVYLSLILKLLEESKKELGNKFIKIQDLILKLISNMYLGFLFETENLNINKTPINTILRNWKSKYLKRNILFDGVYDYAPLIGFYIGSNKDIFENFEKNVSEKYRYGHLGQVINDLSDFSSVFDENVKSYQDGFSDLRNGIITRPTFELLNNKHIQLALKNPEITKKHIWRQKAIQDLIKNKIIEKIKKETKKGYEINISFWRNNVEIKNEFLEKSYGILLKNKYYEEFLKHKSSF